MPRFSANLSLLFNEVELEKRFHTMKKKIIVSVKPCDNIVDILDAWLNERPTHVSDKVVQSIVEQTLENKTVTLARWTHHVPERKDELLFNIEDKTDE